MNEHKTALFLAIRYLFFRRKGQFINLLSLISFLGVLSGTAALILVLSVFNGLENLFSQLSGRQEPTIVILPNEGKYFEASDSLLNIVRSTSGAPFGFWIEESVLIRHNQLELIGMIRGMPTEMIKLAGYDTCLINGNLPTHETSIAVSAEVAGNLGISPGPFDQITELFAPQPGKISVLQPERAFKREAYLSTGVFVSGSEKSKLMVLSNLSAAQFLVGKPGLATGIALFGKESRMEEIVSKLKAQLGKNYVIQDRFQQQEAVYAVFRSEKLWSLLLLSVLTGLAALNLIGSLSMLILHKKHDLFILGTMGMTVPLKQRVFKYTGLLISAGGMVVGISVGAVLIWLQQRTGWVKFNGGSELLEAYPVQIQWGDIGTVCFIVMICSLLCLWLPIRKIKD